jgi:XTP/dITP diphosphohydrolase
MTIYFVTSNTGKFEEVKDILPSFHVVQKDIGYPEIQSSSLKDIIVFGLNSLRDRGMEKYIIEDSGLFIDAFQGFPGVYSAYAYQSIGSLGILKLMEGVVNRCAVFRSMIGYRDNSADEVIFFEGMCKGTISEILKGEQGFGFDPIFIPQGSTLTFAQMIQKEKNRYSHRGKSVRKLKNFLRKR